MSTSGFDQFAEALVGNRVDEQGVASRFQDAPDTARPHRVTVLGGGDDARQLAALCCAAGARVTLFSAYGRELDAIRKAAGITLRGAGPIGTFQVDQADNHSIVTTAELDRAVADAELIFLTGPVHKQRTYAMVLADHIREGQLLVVAPARSFAAFEVASLLKMAGRAQAVSIAELSSLPFHASAEGSVLQLLGSTSAAAAIHCGNPQQLDALAALIGPLNNCRSVLHSSFADGSGLVQVPALLFGGPACPSGQPVIADGGVALAENNTFRNLIGSAHQSVIQQMATERISVAAQYGVRDLPAIDHWLDEYAGAESGDGSMPVPEAAHASALLRCAVTGSLVPLVSAARLVGVSVSVTESIVSLASTVVGGDLATAGRKLEAFGVDASSADTARRSLHALLEDRAHGH